MEDSHSRCRRFHQVFAQVEAGGHLTHTAFTLASGLSRNQTDVRLVGEAADALLLGCAITDGRQHVDNNTLIDHRAPGCQSRELYKYDVDQQSSGAFAGRVLVRQEAQQTDSIERNANLVCTDQARMWTQPMLEIYADDVKCSHGSTLGQLNDEALFYMRQRGISDSEARMLLKQAFASEVLAAIPLEALRQRRHVLVEKRFRSCEDCKRCQR
jgi:Fe-S cluster assembly protein SufD